jgi:N,N'-diacetyllegionaminate synthase
MKTFIIAEAGVNHNGNIEIAKRMVDAAVDCGVNAIKFQTFKAENIVTINAPKAEYQMRKTNASESQFKMIKKLELDEEAHRVLFNYCVARKIEFISSPFDLQSIRLLKNFHLKFFKIPSGEITNLPYLKEIGRLNKKIILSTGMSYLAEVKDAFNTLKKAGTNENNITILHCNTEYPTPFVDVNLNAMLTIKSKLNVKVGYSDHTKGIEVPIAAVALGAVVIEKHFTLSRNMKGPDHEASLEPSELKFMVQSIRNIEKSLGDGIKKPTKSEKKNIMIARKSIVANIYIKKGEKFSEFNIAAKRPATGISPMKWGMVIGKIAKHDFKPDDLIEL